MNSKLIKDLPDLVTNDVISQDVASKIEQYYLAKQQQTPNRLFTVFGVLGSLLVGLGIILILAHNWDNFPRGAKTILAFLPLVIGQCFVVFSILKKKSVAWKEASGTFLFFTIGSSIALVSQIYNIPGNLSTYILTWIILSLPLIYLLKSNAVAILNMICITYYACELGYGFGSFGHTPWLYLVM
ncbi:MAG: putative membrane protein, partial [Psychroserpens sp.]